MIWNLFTTETTAVGHDPIVLDLQPPEPKRPTHVVETPDDAEITNNPQNADYLSDKNALARNESSRNDLDLGKAFAQGDLQAAELPTQRGQRGENGTNEKNAEQPQQQEDDFTLHKTASDFRRELLIKSRNSKPPGQQNSSMRARYDNQESRALENGGLSFNTYKWNFAPYMLWLKRKVEQNIFPPPAYTRLGMIEGETLLRFRIYPNGDLTKLEILDFKGHKTLMETSFRAIEISAPFKKLPADFPEPYLEVTAVFKYTVFQR